MKDVKKMSEIWLIIKPVNKESFNISLKKLFLSGSNVCDHTKLTFALESDSKFESQSSPDPLE